MTRTLPLQQKPLTIIQLTDSHLFSESSGRLLGLNTFDSLQWVVELIEEEQLSIDLILATGDIAQEPCIESYTNFKEQVDTLDAPVYWVSGNHDENAFLKTVADDDNKVAPCSVDTDEWRIIMLDSSVEDEVPGYLDSEQLKYLEEQLTTSGTRHVLLCFHHHPIPMKSEWLDAQIISNANELFAITDQFTHIKAIIWGHVHQESDQIRKGVRLLSSPSTSAQFKPGSAEFCVDNEAPGYRWIECYAGGEIETGVSRIEGVSFQVDYSVKGY